MRGGCRCKAHPVYLAPSFSTAMKMRLSRNLAGNPVKPALALLLMQQDSMVQVNARVMRRGSKSVL
jgi:hypothetical protein